MFFVGKDVACRPVRRWQRVWFPAPLLAGVAALASHAQSGAQPPTVIYLVESETGAIHLSDQTYGQSAHVLIRELPAAPAKTPATSTAMTKTRLATTRMLDPSLDRIVLEAASAHAVDPRLVHAVIAVESDYALRAVSPRGAQGLMQLMPATARGYGVTDAFDARQNVQAGTLHLRRLLDQFGQNTTLALAAYNAGAGAVARHGYTVPPFPETTEYVQRVVRRLDKLRNPTITPTSLLSS